MVYPTRNGKKVSSEGCVVSPLNGLQDEFARQREGVWLITNEETCG